MAPSLAVNDGGVDIAIQAGDSLDLYWAVNGSSTWTREVVAGAGQVFSAPSVTGSDGTTDVVAEGPGLSLKYYWAVNGTTTWHQVSLTGPGAIPAPAITTDSARPVVVARAVQGVLQSYASLNTSGNGQWVGQRVNNPGPQAASAATVTINQGSENIAVFGTAGDLEFYWEDSTGAFHEETVAAAGAN